MSLIKSRGHWLLLVALFELAVLFVSAHFFTRELNKTARVTAQSLSSRGMSAEQAAVISQAISSIESNVSWFVAGLGVTLILINLGVFLTISNDKAAEK